MKYISLILALLMIPVVFSATQDFSTTITVAVFNDTANITTEQNVHTYNCISNTTNSFSLTITRNISTAADITDKLSNLTGVMSGLTSTCDTITKQYGDVNRYFSLYNQCNVDYELCKKDKTEKDGKISELSPFKPNYEKCSKDLGETQINLNRYSNEIIPSYQTNLSSMTIRTETAEKSKWLYFFFGISVAAIIFAIIEKRRIGSTQREKVVGLQR